MGGLNKKGGLEISRIFNKWGKEVLINGLGDKKLKNYVVIVNVKKRIKTSKNKI